MVEFDNLNGSFSIIAEGCDPNFLDRLPDFLSYNKEFLLSYGLKLNSTLKQLDEVEKLIVAHQAVADWHTRDFYQGLVAYCGELLCSKISGKWAMRESEPDYRYPKKRYFPIVTDVEGKTYSFSASLELELAYLLDPGLKWDKMDGLYYAVLLSSLRPDLPPPEPGNIQLPF